MITGDYEESAAAIAGEIGMLTESNEFVTGIEATEVSDDQLDDMVFHLNTCARSSPEHKMRIVDSLSRRADQDLPAWAG